jgi:hypothetical protein
MKVYNVNDFAALIGIDWADTKHDICEHPKLTKKHQYTIIKSKPEALHEWAMSLKQRYPNQQIENNYKDTHRNKSQNYFFGAARYYGCLINYSSTFNTVLTKDCYTIIFE